MTERAAAEGRKYLWLRELVRVSPATWDGRLALRAATAVGAPIAVGVLFDVVGVAFWAALSALLAVGGTAVGGYRSQLRGLAISTAISLAGFAAGWTAGLPPPSYLTALIAGSCLAGFLSAFGRAASVGAMQALLVASIAVGIPSLAPFWGPALGFLAGAAFYGLLLVVEAAIDARLPRRRAVAGVLAAIAALAARRAALGPSATPAAAAAEAAARLAAHDQLGALHAAAFDGQFGGASPGSPVRAVLESADAVYDRIVAPGSDAEGLRAAAHALSAAGAALARPIPTDLTAKAPKDPLAQRVAALTAAAQRAVGEGGPSEPRRACARHSLRTTARRVAADRQARSHAMRLGLCMGIAFAMKFVAQGPHWYWVPLTVAIALKPDFGSVAVRALQRCLGTVGGVILGAAALAVLPRGLPMAAAVAALAAAVPWARQLSYAGLVLMMTPIILILLELIEPVASVSVYGDPRILDTFLGAAIVLVFGYYLWPAARRHDFASDFRDAMDGVAAFAELAKGDAPAGEVFDARHEAFGRLGRLHATLRQALAEPPPVGHEAHAWLRTVTLAERLCDSVAALVASREADAASTTPEQIDRLAARLRAVGTGKADPGTVPGNQGQGSQCVALRHVEGDLARVSDFVRITRSQNDGDPYR